MYARLLPFDHPDPDGYTYGPEVDYDEHMKLVNPDGTQIGYAKLMNIDNGAMYVELFVWDGCRRWRDIIVEHGLRPFGYGRVDRNHRVWNFRLMEIVARGKGNNDDENETRTPI